MVARLIASGLMVGMLVLGGAGLSQAGEQAAQPAKGAATAPYVFAYVDVPRVLASSDASKSARELLKKKLADKQKELDAMEAKIKKMKDELDKKNSLIKPEVRQKQAEDIRKQFREYQRLLEDNQAGIDQENSMWTKKIMEALKEVLEEMAREMNYTAIFGKGQVLYSSSSIDITDQVLKRLNKHTEKWF